MKDHDQCGWSDCSGPSVHIPEDPFSSGVACQWLEVCPFNLQARYCGFDQVTGNFPIMSTASLCKHKLGRDVCAWKAGLEFIIHLWSCNSPTNSDGKSLVMQVPQIQMESLNMTEILLTKTFNICQPNQSDHPKIILVHISDHISDWSLRFFSDLYRNSDWKLQ